MTVQQGDRPFARHWNGTVLPGAVVVVVVGSLGIFLYHAVENARNAARSAATT
ncbi:MAG TPA: hypothetical protein VHS97_03105 [Isosphaeraceae bacterium]|nr:hypothetical protein [Isosphaeraceae bacterium]